MVWKSNRDIDVRVTHCEQAPANNEKLHLAAGNPPGSIPNAHTYCTDCVHISDVALTELYGISTSLHFPSLSSTAPTCTSPVWVVSATQ